MTTTGYNLPRLRSEVVLGPGLRLGTRVVHRVKDPRTGCYYRIGQREHFIMRLMDGEHTLEDIGRAYSGEYGRTLGPDNWRQMFILLGRYQLLDGDVDEAVLDRIRSERAAREKNRPDGWLSRRWVLVHPDRVCAALAGRLSFAFHRAFVIPALILVVLSQIVVWAHTGLLVSDATSHVGWPVVAPSTLILAWLITMVHELAHGVACRYFGGEVTEIGVRWHFPLLAPYCRTDDIVLFHRRTARVGTAFAGIFAGLLAMLPVLAWWWFSDQGGMSRSMAAGLLLFGSGGSLVALMPFLQLDGYVMLTHGLNVADLRAETHRYWGLQAHRRRPESREALNACPPRLARACILYGIASLLALAGVCCALVWLWYGTLEHYLGAVPAIGILAAEAVVVAGLAAYVMRRRSSTKKAAHG
ncbi:MAG TPA: hypothetical protein VIS29_11675 [Streptomyces sp.]